MSFGDTMYIKIPSVGKKKRKVLVEQQKRIKSIIPSKFDYNPLMAECRSLLKKLQDSSKEMAHPLIVNNLCSEIDKFLATCKFEDSLPPPLPRKEPPAKFGGVTADELFDLTSELAPIPLSLEMDGGTDCQGYPSDARGDGVLHEESRKPSRPLRNFESNGLIWFNDQMCELLLIPS